MFSWAVVILMCLGYFLYEAGRAPIVEEDKVDDDDNALSSCSDAPDTEPPVAPRSGPTNDSPNQ